MLGFVPQPYSSFHFGYFSGIFRKIICAGFCLYERAFCSKSYNNSPNLDIALSKSVIVEVTASGYRSSSNVLSGLV